MNIYEKDFPSNLHHTTYFNGGSVEPDITDDGSLTIYSGTGEPRSWGTPGCNSIIVYNDDSLTVILIGFFHKHGGSQFYRYYRNGKRLASWKQLDDGERMLILDAYAESHVPKWAKLPGKLKRDYLKPKELQRLEIDEQGTIYGYKFLRFEDGKYFSVARISNYVEWENGELESDKEPTEENTNGIYCLKSRKSPTLLKYSYENRVLVKLALSGTVIEANEGMRAQCAQIVEVIF